MNTPNHYIAVIGGAVSGSEAAWQFAERGIKVAVFEKNILPYGKIEDGLPKWHVKLRNKEEQKINKKLSHPLITYLPNTELGNHVNFQELLHDWGFSAVLLAVGAWRDRPLPVNGIDEYVHKGLYYQNPFIYWFNHHHEASYKGLAYDTPDGAVIIGGGLASLDVAKALMFINVEKALRQLGYETNLFALDRSIAKVLDSYGLTLQDLGLKGCTLYYRRRPQDMPLTPLDADTPEEIAKAEKTRAKIFNNYQSKYLFNFEPLHTPIDKVVENDRLTGLVFQRTKIVNRRVEKIEGSEYVVKAPAFFSSIGSLPAPIPGIPMNGNVFKINQQDCCQLEGYANVFALGNAVTGRGNIFESLRHGRRVSQEIIDKYGFDRDELVLDNLDGHYKMIEQQVDKIFQSLKSPLTPLQMEEIEKKIKSHHIRTNYTGNIMSWVHQHLPPRLEELIDGGH